MKDLKLNEALTLLDSCPIAMLLIGGDNIIRDCNQAFTALTGVISGTLDSAMQQELLAPLLGDGGIINWVTPNGDEHWLSLETVALGDTGTTARFYQDITEKLRLKKERDAFATELSEQSLKDKRLTSLLSRHGILVSMGPLVARSRRYNSPLSVIGMSIDSVEERETVLRRISLLLKDQTRWADLVGCNTEGDFILVLQEATRDSALQLVEKISARLAAANADSPEPVLACYGIAECDKNDDAASLLERAESAMAEAHNKESRTSIAM
ncbi:MAG: diguanylate cyclase [Gammaproteobacteria bacterium]